MERDQFVAYDFWLMSHDEFPTLLEKRKLLGPRFDVPDDDEPWFRSLSGRGRVYEFLEKKHPDLLRQLDEAHTPDQREQWLDRLIQAEGLLFDSTGNPATAKMGSKVGTIDDFTSAQHATPEKPPASGDQVTAGSKSSPFKKKAPAPDDTGGASGASPTAPKPAAESKPPSPFKKRIVAGREIPLALDELDAVLAASGESEEDPAEDTLRRLGEAISDHKTATDAGWGSRLSTILGLCDYYLSCHGDPSFSSGEPDKAPPRGQRPLPRSAWASKRVAVVEDLKAAAMLERARRLAEDQYLQDAYAQPGASPTALSAQTDEAREYAHKAAREMGARVGRSDPLAGLKENEPMFWATMAAKTYGLTEAEMLAVMVYTSEDYKYINAASANSEKLMTERQFEGKPEDYLTSETGRAEMKRFFEEGSLHSAMAIAALQKLQDMSGTNYRGSRMTPEDFEQWYGDSLNKKYPSRTLSSLTSFSSKKSSAAEFANKSDDPKATVSVMTETEITHGRSISELSLHGGEEETLLLPGLVVQTVSWEEEPNGESGKPAATMWVYVKAREG